jgi:hypothetical protein
VAEQGIEELQLLLGEFPMSNVPSRLAGVCSAVLAATLLAVPGLANATGIKVYSYAAKFLCEQEETEEVDTSVNIHNPSLTAGADIILKIVDPYSGNGGYYVFDSLTLRPDTAWEVECEYFENQAVGPGIDISDFEGFLVVLSKKPLDVVGVYSVEHTGDGEETEDLDVVPVSAQTQTVALSVWTNLIPN